MIALELTNLRDAITRTDKPHHDRKENSAAHQHPHP